ncbi:hypothetical protein [Jiangella mangrovi]|uniref:Fibronectin type-III domain-containing protein n=1 Tax=Jiangella mangrovi TaxID=1524084 RepID=A0A7W9GXF6_9ACTN|nr:hypothetical protein [Jiangella mangrovi]MBB5791782.1 hypothetical protein [Jiangella mangrovi]
MIFDLRLVAYSPNGARLGVLDFPYDLKAALPLNDVSALDVTYIRGMKGSEWLDDFCEVGLEMSAGDEWAEVHNGRFLRLAWDADHLDRSKAFKASMPGYSWLLSKATVRAGGTMNADGQRQFTAATPGQIMRTLILEAQARGALPGMAMDISNASDSDGEPWETEMTIAYAVGTPLDQVLNAMAEQGVIDWNFWGRELHMYNPGTILNRDLTTGPNPVNLRSGIDVITAPDKGDASNLLHRALVLGDDGLTVEVTNPSAVDPWGDFEVTLQQSGVTDAGMATLLAQQALKAGEREQIEMTRDLLFEGRWVPYRDYRVGDTVYAPGVDGAKSAVRILQITLAKNSEGLISGNLTLNNRFVERSLRAAKRARALAGGVVVGGGSGGRPAPEGQDKRTPSAPAGLVVGSSGYIDSNGNPRGLVEATWAPVSTATDGTAMDIQRYEVWGRLNVLGAEWSLRGGSTATFIAMSPYNPGEEWAFRVRAIGLYATTPGEWSDQVVVTIENDTDPPPQPSAPVLSARLGVVRVDWDGLTFEGEEMPSDLDLVEVHASLDEDFTASPATMVDGFVGDRSTMVLSDLPYNDDVWVQFIAVDRAGNRSDPSDKSSIEVTPLVDTDLIGEIIDGANIIDGTLVASDKIVGNSITGGLIQALAIEAGHIAANAITADKIAAGAITTDKLSVGSVAPTHLAGVGVNRVADPGFEDTAYWTSVIAGDTALDAAVGGTWQQNSNAFHGGQYSIECLPFTGSSTMFLTPWVPAPSSRRVYIAGWVRTAGSGGITGASSFAAIFIQYRDAAGTLFFASQQIGLTGTTFDWTRAERTVTLPADTVDYRAYIGVRNHSGNSGRYLFDDVTIQDAIGQDSTNRVQIDPSGMRVYSGTTERIRLDVNGLEAFDNSGNKTVDVDSATGRTVITGSFRTGFVEPYLAIDESALENPGLYVHYVGSSALDTRPNLIGFEVGSGVPAIRLNAGLVSSGHTPQSAQIAANGDWSIGSVTRTATLAAASADSTGTWWMGDARIGTGTAVSGTAAGSWLVGGSRTTAVSAAHGDDDNWWLGYVRNASSTAVSGGRSGDWWIGPSFTNEVTARAYSDVDGNWGIGTNGGARIHGFAGASGDLNLTSNGTIWAVGDFNVSGAAGSGVKAFYIEHPTKVGYGLRHVSTESPLAGVEYWGTGELDGSGQATVELPDYFDALTRPDTRAVLVGGLGAPAAIAAGDVEGNTFTVEGAPGQRFSWLVKAGRRNAEFEVEGYWEAPGPVPGFDLPPESPELSTEHPTLSDTAVPEPSNAGGIPTTTANLQEVEPQ